MRKLYLVNHLGQQSKPLCVRFSIPWWFPSMRRVCMSMSFQKLSLLCWFVKNIISWCVLFLAGFYVCFLGMYVSQCPPPYKKISLLGGFKLVVFISVTCMPISYSVNHLGQHSKPFLVGFSHLASFHLRGMYVCKCHAH